MSHEKPEAERIRLRVAKVQTTLVKGVQVWVSFWQLYQVNKKSPIGLHYHLVDASIPCRAILYKLLVGLVLDWNWNFQGDKDVTEEEAKYLKIILEHQKEYKLWRKAWEILRKDGKERAWEWIRENTPMLVLKDKLKVEGGDENG